MDAGGRPVNIGGYPGGFVVGSDYGNVFGINGLSQVVATSTFPGDEITRQLLWSDGGGPFVIAEDGIPTTRTWASTTLERWPVPPVPSTVKSPPWSG